MANNNMMIGVGVLIVIIIIGALVLFGTNSSAPIATTTQSQSISQQNTTVSQSSSSSGSASVPVMITDPAQVPAGTSALLFTYSNMQVNSTGPSGSQWINATGSGSVNLIDVLNMTKVMGYANVTAGASISQVSFLVNTVQITVNGTTYNVPVSNPQLTLTITGNHAVNAGSGVLIDYTPTVSPAFNANATTFVRVPSGKAVITGNINSSTRTNVGFTFPISATAQASIASATPTLTITSATLAASGNNTVVSTTVTNNGNSSVTLSNLILYGSQNVNASASAGLNASLLTRKGLISGNISATGLVNVAALVQVQTNLNSYAMQNFAASPGGSLTLVTSLSSAQTSGVTLAPGASATLSYTGVASYNSGAFQTTPKAGAQYMVYVGTSSGASATTKVTAS